MSIPSSKQLIVPVLSALKNGRTFSKTEIEMLVAASISLSPEDQAKPHDGSRSEFQYRCAWALTYGKKAGYLVNPSRSVWGITDLGKTVLAGQDSVV